MKKRYVLTGLLLAVICFVAWGILPMTAQAATVVESGTCGEDLTWKLDYEGTMTISGTGGRCPGCPRGSC